MPHSSGGGSSWGGSHSSGGGFHSSGGGSSYSGPSARISHKYRPGDHVFVYYGAHGPRYYYSKAHRKAVQSKYKEIIFWICAVFVFFCFTAIVSIIFTLFPSITLGKVTKNLAPCTIEDDAGSFSAADSKAIEEACRQYYAFTGIPIEIHTITEDEYLEANKSSLEIYAYYDYVNRFDDEDHWLIVFEDIDPQKRTWAFEGMQGDNTDDWLSTSVTDSFNNDLTSNLWNEDNTYGEAFASSLTALAEEAEKELEPDIGVVLCFIAMLAFNVILIRVMVKLKKRLDEYHEVVIPAQNKSTGPELITCDFCGGTYVFGEHTCPHCGAPGKTVNAKAQ